MSKAREITEASLKRAYACGYGRGRLKAGDNALDSIRDELLSKLQEALLEKKEKAIVEFGSEDDIEYISVEAIREFFSEK